MILQALYEYYQRKPEIHTPIGYEIEEIDFVILLDNNGKMTDLQNRREGKRGQPQIVPKAVVRAGKKISPNLLWDNFEYVTGLSKDPKRIDKAIEYNKAFIQKINLLPDYVKDDEGVKSVIKFYNSDYQFQIKSHPNFEECLKIGGWISFQIEGDLSLIVSRDAVKKFQASEFLSGKYEEEDMNKIREGSCLITGEKRIIKRLHTELRLAGSDKNVKIVAIQENQGFDSYKKERGYNAPVSIEAEANYSAALKHLLNSKFNKISIADTTVLFWAEKQNTEINPEEIFPWVIALQKSEKDDPDAGINRIKKLFESIYTGQIVSQKTNHFYVLGLAPNSARISVRFWKAPSVEEFGKNIKQHFDDFEIIHGQKEQKYLSLYQILSSTALAYKMENVPPNLAGAVIESIIDGTPYPQTLAQQCIRRIRAEQNVNRARAAILKAYLNRKIRFKQLNQKEITMALDTNNTNVGYLLGRLFSVIERAQFVSNNYKEPNSGIRDRFFGAFSSSPISVLPILEKLYSHHYKKIKNEGKFREANRLEDWKKDIIDKLEAIKIPAHLTLENQALFTIGYYHQKMSIENQRQEQTENKFINE